MRDFAVGISIVSEYAGGVSGQGMVRLFQAHTLALANGWFFLVSGYCLTCVCRPLDACPEVCAWLPSFLFF